MKRNIHMKYITLFLSLIMLLSLSGCTNPSAKSGFKTARENIDSLRTGKQQDVANRETPTTEEAVTEAPTAPENTEPDTTTEETTTELTGDARDVSNIVGDWICCSMVTKDQTISRDDMKKLWEAGMFVYMTAKDDGTITLYIFNEGVNLKWDDTGIFQNGVTDKVPYTLDGDLLSLVVEDESMNFERVSDLQGILNGTVSPDSIGSEKTTSTVTPSANWEDNTLLELSFAVPDNFKLVTSSDPSDENNVYDRYYILYDGADEYHRIDVAAIDKSTIAGQSVSDLERIYAEDEDGDFECYGFVDGTLENIEGNVRKSEGLRTSAKAQHEFGYIIETEKYIYFVVLNDVDELSNFRLAFEKKLHL